MNIEAIRLPQDQRQPALRELFADSRDGSVAGFLLAHLSSCTSARKPLLWVQERMTLLETGAPSPRAIMAWGVEADIIRVCAARTADLLWTMEEGLRCAGVSAVVGEIWGDPPALGFTATKRLMMRAKASGVPAWLMRVNAPATLSAAHERWRVRALPSAPNPHDARAPGPPRWSAELFRARWRRPGQWIAHYDAAANRLHLDPWTGDGTLDEAEVGATVRRALG